MSDHLLKKESCIFKLRYEVSQVTYTEAHYVNSKLIKETHECS